MKVFMINSGYDGCCYVRMMLPAFHNGFSMDRSSRRSERKPINDIKHELFDADVVVFHRPEHKSYHTLVNMLKKDGKKIVIDNDDTFKLDDYHPLAQFGAEGEHQESLKARNDSMDGALKIADLVTCSTEFLAEEYRKINDNVVVLPNCVDQYDWDEPLRNEGKKTRIGIVGSAAIEYDYLHVKDD